MGEGLKEVSPKINTLGTLDLEDHITGNRNMWHDLVPLETSESPHALIYIMQVGQAPVQGPYTPKKETSPDDIWELQQISLCRLCKIDNTTKLLKICKTIAPLSKEKVRAVIEVVCLQKALYLRYTPPTHLMR